MNHPNVVIADIAAYVHRPKEVRLQEVAQCKIPGKIKRPMNAFMLYRKTYQNLAKVLCTQNNHQIVSQVCGDGWPLEPERIRDQFNKWAKIERENHQNAHPNYKFTPSKPAKKPKRVDYESDEGSTLGDPNWAPGRPPRQAQAAGAPMSIYDTHQTYGSPNVGLSPPSAPPPHPNHSGYSYPNVGRPMSVSYDDTGTAEGHYYQQSMYSAPVRDGLLEDVMVRRTPSPVPYGRDDQIPHQAYYVLPSQYPPMPHHVGPEQAVDPSLMSRPEGVRYDGFYDGFGLEADTQWQAQQDMSGMSPPGLQESMAPLDDVLAQDPQLGYLRGDGDSWQVEELGGHNPQFDTWPA